MPRWICGEPNEERLSQMRGGPLDGMMAEYMAVDQEEVVKAPGRALLLPDPFVTARCPVTSYRV